MPKLFDEHLKYKQSNQFENDWMPSIKLREIILKYRQIFTTLNIEKITIVYKIFKCTDY